MAGSFTGSGGTDVGSGVGATTTDGVGAGGRGASADSERYAKVPPPARAATSTTAPMIRGIRRRDPPADGSSSPDRPPSDGGGAPRPPVPPGPPGPPWVGGPWLWTAAVAPVGAGPGRAGTVRVGPVYVGRRAVGPVYVPPVRGAAVGADPVPAFIAPVPGPAARKAPVPGRPPCGRPCVPVGDTVEKPPVEEGRGPATIGIIPELVPDPPPCAAAAGVDAGRPLPPTGMPPGGVRGPTRGTGVRKGAPDVGNTDVCAGPGAPGPAARAGGSASDAAPRTMACLGCASTDVGRPSSPETIWETSGMRDDPPTSSTVSTCSAEMSADSRARCSEAIVDATEGRIIVSNSPRVRRTSVCSDGQEHGDRRLGVRGERLLGQHAVLAQAHDRAGGGRVREVERGDRAVEGAVDVAEHGLVEVDAAEALDALGRTEDLEAAARGAQDGGVEGAAAEVVDGDGGAVGDPLVGRVVRGGGLRLGDHRDVVQPGHARDLLEQLPLVRAPVRRVGQPHRDRRPALPLGDLGDHLAELGGHEVARGVRRAAQQDGHRVAEAALDLARDAVRFRGRAAVGRVAGEHAALGAHEDDGGHRGRPVAQRGHLDMPLTDDRSRRVGRAEIDPQPVRHRNLPNDRHLTSRSTVAPDGPPVMSS